jgi:hypothetical protein
MLAGPGRQHLQREDPGQDHHGGYWSVNHDTDLYDLKVQLRGTLRRKRARNVAGARTEETRPGWSSAGARKPDATLLFPCRPRAKVEIAVLTSPFS